MHNKYCHILLMYQLLGAAHFSLWWFPFARRQSPYLTSPLHLLILFWITVTLPHASEMCLTSTATFVLCISLIQFQALLHPKAECGCGVTFDFCYRFICHHLFFLSSGPLVPYDCVASIFVRQVYLQMWHLPLGTQHFLSFQVIFKTNSFLLELL